MLDRQADRSRYHLKDMRDYLPQYTSLGEYEQSLAEHPLRRVLSGIAAMTMQSPMAELLAPPRMIFVGFRQEFYPFKVVPSYIPPGGFPQQFRAALLNEQQIIAAKSRALKQLLAAFKTESNDWEEAYRHETSRRWRAWYDLTRGRMLATLVRSMEYDNACRELPGRIPGGSNHVALHPAEELALSQSQALATEARMLLIRCVEANPDTPWADLAQWELDKGFGLGYTWHVIPPPRPAPASTRQWRRAQLPELVIRPCDRPRTRMLHAEAPGIHSRHGTSRRDANHEPDARARDQRASITLVGASRSYATRFNCGTA